MRIPIGLGVAAVVLLLAGAARADTIPGDVELGAGLYDRCLACHSPARNRTGPKHCGVMDRTAGTLAGYRYSESMRESGIVWTAETLDAFLEAPRKFMPGTKMTYAGVPDPTDRVDLIAYLATLREDAEACR
ncbi:MAG: cytochrome c family protein [Proteobacteria bacterium]|nr:cytochrome c family protein [Pseudomonadota bacterium]